MIAISFAMTSDAYADGSKTETRRFWKPSHAAKFQPGRVFMGWTKDPRAGGVRIHPGRVVFCRRERLGDITEDSFRREGGTRYWRNREAYIKAMGGANLILYALRFEHQNLELINESTPVRCRQCGYEGFPDAKTILGIGPIYGCPACDAIVALLDPINPNAPEDACQN